MMDTNKCVADIDNKQDNADGKHDKHENCQQRYLISLQDIAIKLQHCHGDSPMLPNMDNHQRIPCHAYQAVERPPCIPGSTGGNV